VTGGPGRGAGRWVPPPARAAVLLDACWALAPLPLPFCEGMAAAFQLCVLRGGLGLSCGGKRRGKRALAAEGAEPSRTQGVRAKRLRSVAARSDLRLQPRNRHTS